MKKQLIASTLAATLAITSISVTPARANDDVVKFLAGAAAIYIIGSAIANAQNQNQPVTVRPSTRRPANVLPQRCKVRVWKNGKKRNFYRKRCTQNNVRRPGRLPQACLTSIHLPRGWRQAYRAGCLRRNGWVS